MDILTPPRPARQVKSASDEELEKAIDRRFLELLAAQSRRDRMLAWRRMRSLIVRRSPAQILAMEQQRGLQSANCQERQTVKGRGVIELRAASARRTGF